MIPIVYSKNSTQRTLLKKKYYNTVSYFSHRSINAVLNSLQYNGIDLDFEMLLTSEFEDLINISKIIDNHFVRNDEAKNSFCELFDYETLQPTIANFFIEKSNIPISSCFYCEIDYINAFKDIGDYFNVFDFLNNASKKELMSVKHVGEVKANKVINIREISCITNLSQLKFSESIINELENYNKQKHSNHFTLDHFFPQKHYGYLSLSLFNFIPSCYSCNSKFKKAFTFSSLDGLQYISPSSRAYSLNEDLKFKVFFNHRLKNIKSSRDYTLFTEILNNEDIVIEYLDIFKIKGRYTFHKEVLTNLISKRNNYSLSKIKEISKLTKTPEEQVLNDLFGKELSEGGPMSKLKKDIAKDIGIT